MQETTTSIYLKTSYQAKKNYYCKMSLMMIQNTENKFMDEIM